MDKLVIYTCVTGDYDRILQPCPAPDWVDFILFVPPGNKLVECDGLWKIEELPVAWDDPVITSRFPKLSPQSVLGPSYKYSLWIDGNIRISSPAFYEICKSLMDRDVKYAGIKHPFRDCAYDELECVLKDDREGLIRLMNIARYLKANKLPRHFGLMENNIIFRKHNDMRVLKFDRLWQERYVLHSPRRDQLVHSMCFLDVPELNYEYILPEEKNARNSELLEYHRHPAKTINYFQRKWKYGKLWPSKIILHLYISYLMRN